MTNHNVAEQFSQRAQQFARSSHQLEQQSLRLSWSRILLFVLSIIALVYFANARDEGMVLLVLVFFVLGFLWLVKYHNKIKYKKNHFMQLVHINQDEIKRINNQLAGFGQGAQYIHHDHPYTGDLDIFGKHSLFQLINRSNTNGGRDKLAGWMQEASGRTVVAQRQEAVQELAKDLDWCQDFQACGRGIEGSEEDTVSLLNWMKEPTAIIQKKWYLAASRMMPMFAVAAIVAYYLWDISGWIPLGVLFVNGLILWSAADVARNAHQKTGKGVAALKSYVEMISRMESKNFVAPLSKQQKQALQTSKTTASEEIRKISYILDNFDARGNMFYHVINVVLLLDVYWLLQAERWKQLSYQHIGEWFAAVNEMEALVSIAGFAYANAEYVFPTIVDQPYVFVAEELRHCLISKQKSVGNDFATEGKGSVNIITGSNMSGKSTFLRTVGINTVLALMGAPVAAKQLTVSEMQLFTSMRTQDSLEENISSFYAELKRLKQLLDYLKNPEKPVMFMLDEILKGTNSQDRHHGAASLVKQLAQLEACGFISTHDLELGALANQSFHVKNYSFSSTVEHNEIHFDYTIREGICQSFNASQLMAKMGIAIEEHS